MTFAAKAPYCSKVSIETRITKIRRCLFVGGGGVLIIENTMPPYDEERTSGEIEEVRNKVT